MYGGRFEEICMEDDWQQESDQKLQDEAMEYEGVHRDGQ